jgi:hypothetical protein
MQFSSLFHGFLPKPGVRHALLYFRIFPLGDIETGSHSLHLAFIMIHELN